jgi:hypothetical protein
MRKTFFVKPLAPSIMPHGDGRALYPPRLWSGVGYPLGEEERSAGQFALFEEVRRVRELRDDEPSFSG